jgi:ubiquinone/menaquinone biosynthesis C-methylase UbiE
MLYLNRKREFKTVGVDFSAQALSDASQRHTHDSYIEADFRKLDLADKSFDIVLCLEMIEHLEKNEGLKLIERLERIARKQVIISTPVGMLEAAGEPDQPGSAHLSGWSLHDFESRGYRVRGNSLRAQRACDTLVRNHARWLTLLNWAIWFALDIATSPLTYYFPGRLAHDMVCIKNLDAE